MKIALVIAAGGSGKRLKSDVKKQYLLLLDKPILYWTLKPFLDINKFSKISLVVPQKDIHYIKNEIDLPNNIDIIAGGAERHYSVLYGLKSLPKKTDYVFIHDGVRPFIEKRKIMEIIEVLPEFDAITLAVPVKETLVSAQKNQIVEYLNRDKLWLIQTPQAFKYDIIMKAYDYALKTKIFGTDETFLVNRIGKEVKLILGSYNNIKITTQDDYKTAKLIIKEFEY